MGMPMALNLFRAGLLQTYWNRSADKMAAMAAETDIHGADSPAAVAAECELILTCVSRDEDLEQVIEALLPGLNPDSIVVDTSTVSVQTARSIAHQLQEKSAHFLDVPVSGGVEGAKNGSLAMMVGGEAAILQRAMPVLEVLSGAVNHIGPTGSGQATKAVNQVLAAGINQAVCEALAFGQALDLPMDKVIDVVSSGAAGNWFLAHRGKTMLRETFTPGFRLALHHKDLQICMTMAEQAGTRLPLSEQTVADYETLMAQGLGDEDISALFRLHDKDRQADIDGEDK